jgi:RNA polymerase sigma factor for flagellar operon FliA
MERRRKHNSATVKDRPPMPSAASDSPRYRAFAPESEHESEHQHDTAPDRDLWKRYKSTGSVTVRNRLVRYYMARHVRPIAARIHAGLPAQIDLDDLVQQGYFGLVDAMDRFEIDRDTRFETFSRRRIFGAIQDYLRHLDSASRLSRARSKRLHEALDRFWVDHGRKPGGDELRATLDLSEAEFARFIADARPPAQVPFSSVQSDATGDDENEPDTMHAFEDHREGGPFSLTERLDMQRWLIRDFDRRDRLIVVLYYYEQMTMREIGRALGISESRVSQRLDSILRCLRARLTATGAEAELVI